MMIAHYRRKEDGALATVCLDHGRIRVLASEEVLRRALERDLAGAFPTIVAAPPTPPGWLDGDVKVLDVPLHRLRPEEVDRVLRLSIPQLHHLTLQRLWNEV
jgi:hypothetical protein